MACGDIAKRQREKGVVGSPISKTKGKVEPARGTKRGMGQHVVAFLWWEEDGETNPR